MWLDIDAIRAGIQAGDTQGVIPFLRGRILGDLDLPDAHEFNEWREHKQRQVEVEVADFLRQAARDAEAMAAWSAVVELCDRSLMLDPWDEKTIRRRTLAIASLGDARRALRELENTIDEMVRYVGAPVAPQTAALRDVLINTLETEHRTPAAPDVDRGTVPFVGRSEEYARIHAAFREVLGGHSSVVTVVGDSGIGKTRLCTHFVDDARRRGARVLSARGHHDQQLLSAGCIADLLLSGVEAVEVWRLPVVWQQQIIALTPELSRSRDNSPASAQVESMVTSERGLFEALAELLEHLCQTSPLVLFVDDLQWADQSSVAALAYLARRLSAKPIMFLLTARDTVDQQRSAVRSFWASLPARNEVIALEQLDENASLAILRAVSANAGRRYADEVLHAVYGQTGGSPLLLVECCIDLAATLAHSEPLGSSSVHFAIPSSVERMFTERLSGLSPLSRRYLEAAAVLGTHATLANVCRIIRLSLAGGRRIAAQLASRRVLQRAGNLLVFPHPIWREYLLNQLPAPTRRELHGRAFDALGALSGIQSGVLAAHALAGGRAQAAYRHGVAAALRSYRTGAYGDVEHYLRIAEVTGSDPDEKCEAYRSLALFLTETRRFEEAVSYFDCLTAWAPFAADPEGRVTAALARIALRLANGTATPAALLLESHAVAKDAYQQTSDTTLIGVLRTLVSVAHSVGDVQVAEGLRREIADRARSATRPETIAELYAIAANSESVYGSAEVGVELGDQAIAAAEHVQAPTVFASALMARGIARLLAAHIRGAQQDLLLGLDIAQQNGLVAYQPLLQINLAVACIEIGDFDQARVYLDCALRTSSKHDEVFALANLAALHWEVGDWSSMRATAMTLLQRNEGVGMLWASMVGYGFVGLADWELGDRVGACEAAEIVGPMLRSDVVVVDKSYAGILVARALVSRGSPDGAVKRLDEVKLAPGGHGLLSRWRVDLERASILKATNPSRAWGLATQVMAAAEECGARTLMAKAERIREDVRYLL